MANPPWRPWELGYRAKKLPRIRVSDVSKFEIAMGASLVVARESHPRVCDHTAQARAAATRAPIRRPSRKATLLAGQHWMEWEKRVAERFAVEKPITRYRQRNRQR